MTPRKFRVWDGEEMHDPPHDYLLTGHNTVHLSYRYRHGHEGHSITTSAEVLFYTGLDDAESTPIYEGDIVTYGGTRGVVGFADYNHAVTLEGVHNDEVPIVLGGSQVIGNRYEDPDLLETTEPE